MTERAWRGLRAAAAAAVLGSTLPACGVESDWVDESGVPEARARTFAPVQWRRVARIGGSAGDTTLRMPSKPAPLGDGFVVADVHTGAVTRYSLGGERRWTVRLAAPGSRPGAIRQVDVDARGRAWVLDQHAQRVTVLDSLGNRQFQVPTGAAGQTVLALAPLPGDEVMLLTPETAAPLVRLSRTGRVLARLPLAWPGYRALDYMSGQLALGSAPGSRRWVAAFQTGDGFFLFDDDRSASDRLWYVEHVRFPRVRKRTSGAVTVTRTVRKPVFAASSIAVSPTRVYILFDGASERRKRIVDAYSLADGRYLESLLLPERVAEITWLDGGLLTVTHDPYAALQYLKAVDHALP